MVALHISWSYFNACNSIYCCAGPVRGLLRLQWVALISRCKANAKQRVLARVVKGTRFAPRISSSSSMNVSAYCCACARSDPHAAGQGLAHHRLLALVLAALHCEPHFPPRGAGSMGDPWVSPSRATGWPCWWAGLLGACPAGMPAAVRLPAPCRLC